VTSTQLSKYAPLRAHLESGPVGEVTLAFGEIGVLVGGLPESASRRTWWANTERRSQAISGWLAAGRRVESVDLRTRANRSWVRAPAVCPLDEFDGEDAAGDGEVDLGESLVAEPVGVAA